MINTNLGLLILLGQVLTITTTICSNTIKTGPYTLPLEEEIIEIPSKLFLKAVRIKITKDVTIAMMYRAYWSSYCYNGGSLDPNTGCEESIVMKRQPNGLGKTNVQLAATVKIVGAATQMLA